MKRKWISLLLTMTMMASMLTGCGGGAPSSGGSQSADTGGSGVQESGDSQGGEQESGTSGEADGDLVPVTWMILGMDYEESDTWPTETFKDLQEALREYAGVELTMEGCDAQELDLLLAGSELPDIITVNRDYCNTLLTGKKVMKLALTVRSRGSESRKKTEKGILSVRYQSVPARRPVIATS